MSPKRTGSRSGTGRGRPAQAPSLSRRSPVDRRPPTAVPEIILASASPRRRKLLKAITPRFRVVPAGVDEEALRTSDPAAFARRAARHKAWAVARSHPGALVIAADTLVSLGREVFGKPRSRAEARDMLRRLSGRRHRVVTAVVLASACPRRSLSGSATSWVTFRTLADRDIERALDETPFLDKAGAYAIQESGRRLVARLEGDRDNVIGFPTRLVRLLLEEWAAPRPAGRPKKTE